MLGPLYSTDLGVTIESPLSRPSIIREALLEGRGGSRVSVPWDRRHPLNEYVMRRAAARSGSGGGGSDEGAQFFVTSPAGSSLAGNEMLIQVTPAPNWLSLWLPKTKYRPGEVVVGQLRARTDKDVEIKGVKIQMKGTARCGWDEGAGETFIDYQNSARLFPDQEVVIDMSRGAKTKDKDQSEKNKTTRPSSSSSSPQLPDRLEAGQEYEWPFTFRLPDSLPPSVAWRDRSYISVDLVGAADIPRSLNQEVRFGLDVAPSPPPTIAPSVLGTQQVTRTLPVKCGPLGLLPAGQVELSLSTESGFLPFSEDPGAGPMPVFKGRIDVRNKSKKDIQSLRLSLIMRVEQTAGPTLKEDFVLWREVVTAVPLPPDKTLEDRRFLGALKVKRVPQIVDVQQENGVLQVPTIVTDPLSFTYRLELEAIMPGGNNPTVSVPVLVAPLK